MVETNGDLLDGLLNRLPEESADIGQFLRVADGLGSLPYSPARRFADNDLRNQLTHPSVGAQ
jgi:hypothetical protein